jgi:hypothetical protein
MQHYQAMLVLKPFGKCVCFFNRVIQFLSYEYKEFKSPNCGAASWTLTAGFNDLAVCYCSSQPAGLHVNSNTSFIKVNVR